MLLEKHHLKTICDETVDAISIAKSGAMGCPEQTIILMRSGVCYYSRSCFAKEYISSKEIVRHIISLREWGPEIFPDAKSKPYKSWIYINLGYGNHLFMKEHLYKLHKDKIDTGIPHENYSAWMKMVSKHEEHR